MFPILHLGRPWLAYWLIPYPNTMWLWPQPRSPLIWDVFAVIDLRYRLVHFLVHRPDSGFRDHARSRQATLAEGIFGMLAMGWRGSAKHWARYQKAYLLLAGLSTPLVVSVHSVVSFDFAISLLPGWHTTIFPPYFVAGAIYSGFAMVLTLAIPVRRWYHLEDLITMRHIECMAKVMLGTGLIVAYGYAMEAFMAWYSGNPHEMFMYYNRATWTLCATVTYWMLILCNIADPAIAVVGAGSGRTSDGSFSFRLVVNVGMWLERFVIVVTSLTRDFVPSSWGMYYPTSGIGRCTSEPSAYSWC